MSKPTSRASTTAAAGPDAATATNTSSTSALEQASNQAAGQTGAAGPGTEQDDERAVDRSDAGLGTRASSQKVAFYEVMDCPILHDHELYEPGDQLELTDREAGSLGRLVRLVRD